MADVLTRFLEALPPSTSRCMVVIWLADRELAITLGPYTSIGGACNARRNWLRDHPEAMCDHAAELALTEPNLFNLSTKKQYPKGVKRSRPSLSREP